MEEEIKKILKLLEEGKITAEDAEKLIETIEEKRESRRKGIGFLDIGGIVAEAITSALSVVPNLVSSGLKGKVKADEVLDWDLERPLYIEVSAGDVSINISEESKIFIDGEGDFSIEDNVIRINAGDFNLTIPKLKALRVNLLAGDLKGKVICDEFEVYVKMGDASLDVDVEKIQGNVNMGDLSIKFLDDPSFAKLNCNMGDITVFLPENFDGKVVVDVPLGSLSVERKADNVRGNTYIYGSGEKSYIELRCNMGDVSVR
ncbi:MAG: DUF4097 domain-containing protein [Dictyoglomus thermophilum]|uniref:Uncharacterized protein n=1 Tax=Dictyoglomus thermophilum TaxID=14 RepID=A0A7C3KR47_DICTH|nr:DUF4097 family beta strand repeat-containing protein [Dictyoglomus thermophilum]MCX7720561.1 DUF4097 domain-containing protein [Dictyoglomus thermophilum]